MAKASSGVSAAIIKDKSSFIAPPPSILPSSKSSAGVAALRQSWGMIKLAKNTQEPAGEDDGTAGRRPMARGHSAHHQRPFRPAVLGLPQFRHARRQSRPDRQGRLQGRARPLPPLYFARLPLGASHPDLPHAEKARQCDLA